MKELHEGALRGGITLILLGWAILFHFIGFKLSLVLTVLFLAVLVVVIRGFETYPKLLSRFTDNKSS